MHVYDVSSFSRKIFFQLKFCFKIENEEKIEYVNNPKKQANYLNFRRKFFMCCKTFCDFIKCRYPVHWANTLRKMNTFNAELLLPGHGPPIIGAQRVKEALENAAAFLDNINAQFFKGVNKVTNLSLLIK